MKADFGWKCTVCNLTFEMDDMPDDHLAQIKQDALNGEIHVHDVEGGGTHQIVIEMRTVH